MIALMADIKEYHHVEFTNHVKPQGHGKLIKMSSTPQIKLYRDMSEPDTLVIEHQHPLRRDEVPWVNVSVAYSKGVPEKKVEPKQETLQGQQGKGR